MTRALVTLHDAYNVRPLSRFPADRFTLKTDQKRGEVVAYCRATGVVERVPVSSFLIAGEACPGALIDGKGRPLWVYGEAAT